MSRAARRQPFRAPQQGLSLDRAGVAAGAAAVLVVLGLAACGSSGVGADTEERMAYAGIARDLVYVTDVDGFDVAVQSAGVSGDDGFAAAYVGEGGTLWVRTSRRPAGQVEPCADLDASADVTACEVVHDDVHVLLEGDGVDATTLREAGAAVRPARDGELAQLLAELPAPPDGEPVERGDLPPGDGAPDNSGGQGG
ncbi:hypothetical protein [Cellulomonas palmilytica]|uniref:hypothetical protein n=1 Tax=Cellulomonas palmilytica TaxID=2608402 RepID=UPI001F25FBA8|nr:hypothetical protein [Cellulomonas palmilytica]